MSMLFTINDSPFFGKEGKFCTSRHIQDRLNKELDGLEKEIARAEGKLNNAGFVSKAPAALVQQERDKLAANQVKAASLRKRIDELKESL